MMQSSGLGTRSLCLEDFIEMGSFETEVAEQSIDL